MPGLGVGMLTPRRPRRNCSRRRADSAALDSAVSLFSDTVNAPVSLLAPVRGLGRLPPRDLIGAGVAGVALAARDWASKSDCSRAN